MGTIPKVTSATLIGSADPPYIEVVANHSMSFRIEEVDDGEFWLYRGRNLKATYQGKEGLGKGVVSKFPEYLNTDENFYYQEQLKERVL